MLGRLGEVVLGCVRFGTKLSHIIMASSSVDWSGVKGRCRDCNKIVMGLGNMG